MAVNISHPTDRSNFTEVTVGDVTLYFSYRTCVAFHTNSTGFVVSENIWSKTTGKHLNWICEDKSKRVSATDFDVLLEQMQRAIRFDPGTMPTRLEIEQAQTRLMQNLTDLSLLGGS